MERDSISRMDDDDDPEKTYNWNCYTVVDEVNADDKDN